LTDGKIGLVIADVCDKGLGAALFMTLFRSLIRAVSNIDFFTNAEYVGTLNPARRIENAISLTNNYIAQTHGDTNMFCTIFFGILDTNSGVLTYVNGGHMPPMVINHQGLREKLKLTGPAVGLAAETHYVVGEVKLEPGDVLFAHTDGLSDAVNPQDEYFGVEEVIPLFTGCESLSALLDQVQSQLVEHSSGTTQIDDITLLAVRRKEQ
jgi:serine phosphatase RsbU (regulator of sigma subunit)